MDERLSGLLLRLRERFAPDIRPDEVESFLSSEGYDRGQIGEILGLLFGRRGGSDLPQAASQRPSPGFRVLASHERARFTPDAWGHLLSLSNAGVLTAPELEQIIERSMMQIDGRISIDDLRSLMELSGYVDSGGPSDQLSIH